MVHTGEQSVASLRANSWYRSNVLEQLKTLGNRVQFLRTKFTMPMGTRQSAPQKDPRPRYGENSKRTTESWTKAESELPCVTGAAWYFKTRNLAPILHEKFGYDVSK